MVLSQDFMNGKCVKLPFSITSLRSNKYLNGIQYVLAFFEIFCMWYSPVYDYFPITKITFVQQKQHQKFWLT